MLIEIPNLIDPDQLQVIVPALREAPFIDGKLSAGARAKRMKNNRELQQDAEIAQYLNKIILGNLYNNPTFRSAALPHRVATPFFARYEEGMGYGEHIDDPVMGEGQRFRCDVATTIFLNEPDEYDGGELIIKTTFGDKAVKLAGGWAVLYPASSLHRVAGLTRGERLVAVTWVQSMVRDPAKRELLYGLSLARERLMERSPDAEETAQVDHAYTNLVRMWAQV